VQAGSVDVTADVFVENTHHLSENFDANGVLQPPSGTVKVPFLNTFANLGLPRGVYLLSVDEFTAMGDTFASLTGDPVIRNQFGNQVQVMFVIGGLEMCYNSGLNPAEIQECLENELRHPDNHMIQVTNNFTKKHDDPANIGADPANTVDRVSAKANAETILTARTTSAPFASNSDLEFWAFSLPNQVLLSHRDCMQENYSLLQICKETSFIDYPNGANELFIGKSRVDGSGVAHFALPNTLGVGKYYLVFKEAATGNLAVGYLDLLAHDDFWDENSGDGGDNRDQNSHCSDPAYTNQQDCTNGGGIWTPPGTWTPCEEPSWPGNYYDPPTCDDSQEPPTNGSPYPLPSDFPSGSDDWTCVDGVCTSPNYPGWECDESGNCNNDDFAPALPEWGCTPDGICKQLPPQQPEVVCDLNLGANGLCWEVPDHGYNPDEPWPAPGWVCTNGVCTNPGLPGWTCNAHGNCTPPHGDKPYPPAKLKVNKAEVNYHEEFIITGEDFAPNAPVDVHLHSDPHYLGSVVTNSEGKFTLTASVPAGAVPEGMHTVAAQDMRSTFDVERAVPVETGVKLKLATPQSGSGTPGGGGGSGNGSGGGNGGGNGSNGGSSSGGNHFVCTDSNGNVVAGVTSEDECKNLGGDWESVPGDGGNGEEGNNGDGNVSGADTAAGNSWMTSNTGVDALLLLLIILLIICSARLARRREV
jgi:hypothetical protein